MRVRSLACIHDEEVRCNLDDVFDIRDEIGEIYLARNLVARIDLPKKVKAEEAAKIEEKSDIVEPGAEVETAAFEGAPETALGRGSRRSRRKNGANQ